MKEVCLSFVHQTDLTAKMFSVVASCSLEDVPPASIIRVIEAGSSQTMLHIYRLTVAGPRWWATSLPPPWEPQISVYMTLNKSLISQPKSGMRLYIQIYVVCVSSLIVRVSVNKSEGVIVCLWLRSELLTAVRCLPCWDVTPCSLIDMCQDCNWAQGNQT